MSIREALAKLVAGHDLSRAEANAAMRSLVEGEATPSQIAAFAIALRMKGETAEEIAGLASVMRSAATRVDAGEVVDVVGTGGDGAGTFNISTLSAVVVASAGGRVAKHGNRSITSACGAADFLEAIGVAIDLPPSGVARCVDETGFGFMFAPLYHPAMARAASLPEWPCRASAKPSLACWICSGLSTPSWCTVRMAWTRSRSGHRRRCTKPGVARFARTPSSQNSSV